MSDFRKLHAKMKFNLKSNWLKTRDQFTSDLIKIGSNLTSELVAKETQSPANHVQLGNNEIQAGKDVQVQTDKDDGVHLGNTDIVQINAGAHCQNNSDLQPDINEGDQPGFNEGIQPNNNEEIRPGNTNKVQPENNSGVEAGQNNVQPENNSGVEAGQNNVQPENNSGVEAGQNNVQPETNESYNYVVDFPADNGLNGDNVAINNVPSTVSLQDILKQHAGGREFNGRPINISLNVGTVSCLSFGDMRIGNIQPGTQEPSETSEEEDCGSDSDS